MDGSLASLSSDDRAATSVVGTILLVAVVVIVAGVVATTVFSVANEVEDPPPRAAFSIETCHLCSSIADPVPGERTNSVNVTYETGPKIPAERLSVTLDGTVLFDPSETGAAAYTQPANYDGAGPNSLRWSSDEVTAGERVVLEDDADDESDPADRFRPGGTVRVVWTPPDGDRSFVLAESVIRW